MSLVWRLVQWRLDLIFCGKALTTWRYSISTLTASYFFVAWALEIVLALFGASFLADRSRNELRWQSAFWWVPSQGRFGTVTYLFPFYIIQKSTTEKPTQLRTRRRTRCIFDWVQKFLSRLDSVWNSTIFEFEFDDRKIRIWYRNQILTTTLQLVSKKSCQIFIILAVLRRSVSRVTGPSPRLSD